MTGEADDRAHPGPVALGRDILARRKRVALVAFAAAAAALISLIVSLPDLYRSTTTVLVESQQISEALVQTSITGEVATRLQRIRQEVMSRSRLATLITDLNLYPDLRSAGVPFDTLIDEMRRHIHLDLTGVDHMGARGATIAFAISYSGRDPETVAKVANVLASVYVDENTRMRTGQAARAAKFLEDQLAEVKTELDAQERRTTEYKLRHLGELPQQVEANLGTLDRLNTQLRLNSESQIRAMDRRDRLESQLADVRGPNGGASASPRTSQLATLKQELGELRRQYRDTHPEVRRVQAGIAELEQEGDEPAGGPAAPPATDEKARLTAAIEEINAELAALKSEEQSHRAAILDYERRVDNVPRRQEEFQTLSRDYATTKERHDTLLKRYEEAQLAASLERGRQVEQFRILDAALPSPRPAAPARLRLLVAGLVLALMFAAAAAVAVDKLDTSFHTVDDLRASVRGPAIFSIPLIPTRADIRRRRWRSALAAAGVVAALCLIAAGAAYVATDNEKIVRLVARGRM